MAVSPAERLYILGQVAQLAQRDLDTLWRQAAALANVEFAAFVVDAFPTLVDPYAEMAAQLSATWFEESAPASKYVATTAALPNAEKLVKSAQWALGATGDAGKDRLAGTLQRAVFDGARDTTLLNVELTEGKWVRWARADACEFCRMLATRGAVYSSRQSTIHVIGRAGRPRGTQKLGSRYHDHCHCHPIEVRTGVWNPPDYVQKWSDQYDKARADAGSGDTKKILAAWRQLDKAT